MPTVGTKKRKKCAACKKYLSIGKFPVRKGKPISYCRKCHNQASKNWRVKNSGYHRNRSCIDNYGMTYKEKEQLLKFQKRKCAICNKKVENRNAQVDHCHKTKQIRLILCNSCNLAIGKFQDRPELLIRAAEYLSCYK